MQRRWIALAVLLTLVVAIAVATPFAARHLLLGQLHSLGWTAARVGAVWLNPITGTIEIESLDVDGEAGADAVADAVADAGAGTDPLRFDLLRVRLSFLPLFERRLHLRAIELEGATIALAVDADGTVRIAGRTPDQWAEHLAATAAPAAAAPAESPWHVSVDAVELRRFTPGITVAGEALDLYLERVTLGRLATDAPDSETALALAGRVQSRSFRIAGAVRPFHPELPAQVRLPAQLTIDLAPFAPLLAAVDVDIDARTRIDVAGTLALAATATGPRISWDGELGYETHGTSVAGIDVRGRLRWRGAFAVTTPDHPGPLGLSSAGELTVTSLAASASAADLGAAIDTLTMQLELAGDTDDPRIRIESLSAGGISATAAEHGLTLARLSANALTLTGSGEAGFEVVNATGIAALARAPLHPDTSLAEADAGIRRPDGAAAPDHMLTMETATVHAGRIAANATRIGAITLAAPRAFLWHGPDGFREVEGAMALVERFGAGPASAATAPTSAAIDAAPEPTAPDKPAPATGSFRIEHLRITEGTVIVEDHAARPAVRHPIESLNLDIAGLTATTDAEPIAVEARATYADRGRIAFTGHLTPTDNLPTGPYEARLSALPLERISPYLERLGYRLLTGRLDVALDGDNAANAISAVIDLKAHNLELEKLRPEEIDEFTEDLGVPLNTALSLLRDRNGDIELEIPLAGDLASLQAGYSGAIRRAMLSGTKTALKTGLALSFGPVGIAFLVGEKLVGDAGVSFDPIAFPAGQSTLASDAGPMLDRFGELLSERPGFRLKLCGVATAADVESMTVVAPAPLPTEAPGDIPVTTPSSSIEPESTTGSAAAPPATVRIPPDPLALRALAAARAAAVTAALAPRAIDADAQLFPCAPRVAPDDAGPPRVDLRL